MSEQTLELDGFTWKIVEKPTHTAIYKTYFHNGFGRSVMVWNSKKRPTPRIGSTLARVLAAARRKDPDPQRLREAYEASRRDWKLAHPDVPKED